MVQAVFASEKGSSKQQPVVLWAWWMLGVPQLDYGTHFSLTPFPFKLVNKHIYRMMPLSPMLIFSRCNGDPVKTATDFSLLGKRDQMKIPLIISQFSMTNSNTKYLLMVAVCLLFTLIQHYRSVRLSQAGGSLDKLIFTLTEVCEPVFIVLCDDARGSSCQFGDILIFQRKAVQEPIPGRALHRFFILSSCSTGLF